MLLPTPTTVRERIAWSYANLARADAALEAGASRYETLHHIIRGRLYSGLVSGRMSMRSLYHDERLKLTMPQGCVYCGSTDNLAVDHLIPRVRGGADEGENLVWACRSCNSSKCGRDLLEWMEARGEFPSLLLLRRYMKIVMRRCDAAGCLVAPLSTSGDLGLPFDVTRLPTKFPPLCELRRWVYPDEAAQTPAGCSRSRGGCAT